jgi:hypothetical protein
MQDEENFAWSNKAKGLRASWCRKCKSEWSREKWASGSEKQANYESKAKRVKAAHDYIWDLFQNSRCADCGERNPIVFEFDHLSDKFLGDSRMVNSNYGLEKIKEEIAKCDIVCANCHKIRTSQRGNHWRYQRQTQ